MSVLRILEKMKQRRLKFSQKSGTVLYKMAKYQEARANLTNSQLNKTKI